MKYFEIKPYHLKLLKRMYVSHWDCEFGAPCIDPKRPYGNSDVLMDIAEILEEKIKINKDECRELTEKQEQKLMKIHKEMETVLQICLCTQKFKVGKYVKKEEYDDLSWKLIK